MMPAGRKSSKWRMAEALIYPVDIGKCTSQCITIIKQLSSLIGSKEMCTYTSMIK